MKRYDLIAVAVEYIIFSEQHSFTVANSEFMYSRDCDHGIYTNGEPAWTTPSQNDMQQSAAGY